MNSETDDTKPHALFCGHCYYPEGGADDFRAFGTISELKALYAEYADSWASASASGHPNPWGQIVDKETMAVVLATRGHKDWREQ